MAQACPRCRTQVGDDLFRCPNCGEDLDPGRTIPPVQARRHEPVAPSNPPRKAAPRPEAADDSVPPAAPPRRKSSPPRVVKEPVPQARAAPPPQPAPAPIAPVTPAYGQPPPHSGQGYPPTPAPGWSPSSQYPSMGVPPNPQVPAESPAGVRGWMIRMLGGSPQPTHPMPAAEHPHVPSAIYPPGMGAYYGPPPGAIPAPPAYPNPAPPPAPAEPIRPMALPELDPEDADDGETRFISGVNIDKLNIPRQVNTLQILASNGQWFDWGPIHAKGLNVGRAKGSADFPGLNSMAVRHMKFSYSRTTLMVEDLGSLNGTFVQLKQPVELADGMRFRVGSQRFEFHRAEPFEPIPPRVSDDGEEFFCGEVIPLAFLDLIRPDGKAGLRFPITKAKVTILGREHPTVDIALTGDTSVSGSHAQIRHQAGTFLLEDLGSRNGTFVQIFDPYVVKSGDVILAGRVLFRVVDQPAGK